VPQILLCRGRDGLAEAFTALPTPRYWVLRTRPVRPLPEATAPFNRQRCRSIPVSGQYLFHFSGVCRVDPVNYLAPGLLADVITRRPAQATICPQGHSGVGFTGKCSDPHCTRPQPHVWSGASPRVVCSAPADPSVASWPHRLSLCKRGVAGRWRKRVAGALRTSTAPYSGRRFVMLEAFQGTVYLLDSESMKHHGPCVSGYSLNRCTAPGFADTCHV
jgi:hypothetical protein